jgi:hypothetical protein
MQRDLEQLQRDLAAQERLQAAGAREQGGKAGELRIASTGELFEAVRLGIVEAAEARRLLGLPSTEGGVSGDENA